MFIGVHLFHSICRIIFSLVFIMNTFLWAAGSSGALPFGTVIALLALWFCVSTPLTFLGAYFGFRKLVRFKHNVLLSLFQALINGCCNNINIYKLTMYVLEVSTGPKFPARPAKFFFRPGPQSMY